MFECTALHTVRNYYINVKVTGIGTRKPLSSAVLLLKGILAACYLPHMFIHSTMEYVLGSLWTFVFLAVGLILIHLKFVFFLNVFFFKKMCTSNTNPPGEKSKEKMDKL